MSRSVLFVVNGFGMGNATRCDSLCEILGADYRVDILTSDKAYLYFATNRKELKLYRQSDVGLKEHSEFGSIRYYLNYIPHFVKRIFFNFRSQRKLIHANKYDFVIFDSDYSFILHRLFFTKTTLIGLNNSFEVVSFFYHNLSALTLNLLPSFFVELLDFLVYSLFCRFIICPCVDEGALPAQNLFGKFLASPLLVRSRLITLQKAVVTTKKVLIMASSSHVGSDINELEQSADFRHFTFLTTEFKTDNSAQLVDSSVIICNAGQSSISECLYLNKKAFLIAIPRHAEQHANACLAAKKGLTRLNENFDLKALAVQIANFTAADLSTDFHYDYSTNTQILKNHFKHIEKALYD